MIPTTANIPEFTIDAQPGLTYYLNIERDIIAGSTDNIDALQQAIYLILSTERYAHVIYSWNYGVELIDLIGREKQYVVPELKRRITEALLQDDRINSVEDFEITNNKNKYSCVFRVKSIYGTLQVEQGVNL